MLSRCFSVEASIFSPLVVFCSQCWTAVKICALFSSYIFQSFDNFFKEVSRWARESLTRLSNAWALLWLAESLLGVHLDRISISASAITFETSLAIALFLSSWKKKQERSKSRIKLIQQKLSFDLFDVQFFNYEIFHIEKNR